MSENSRPERIDRVISYIEENLQDLECARDVAAVVDVTYPTLRKQFRREMSVPIGTYVRQKRIDKARELLIETDMPAYEICWSIGYSDDSSGIRAFRRLTGMTMEEYRKQYKKS